MRVGGLLQSLLLLLAATCIDAFVFSCEEVKYRLINTTVTGRLVDEAWLVLEEGYTNMEQLEKIYVKSGDNNRSLAYLVEHYGWHSPYEEPWEVVADADATLNCAYEFSLIFADAASYRIQQPLQQAKKFTAYSPEVVVVPQTGFWCKTSLLCGQVYTGSGSGSGQEKYLIRSWQCWNYDPVFPEWVISFDNVATFSFMQTVTDYMTCSSDLDSEVVVAPGDKIFLFTSGLSDDVQNMQAGGHRAKIRINNWEPVDVVVNMTLTFDPANAGSIILQKSYGGPEYNFYGSANGQVEQFRTDYFEVRYVPTVKKPSEISSSGDNMAIEISIGKATSPPPTTVTTTTKPAPTTTPLPVTPPVQTPYCNCGADRLGAPVGWSYNDIWLDIVIVLDASAAMGRAEFEDAGVLIDSLISDGKDDFLITDPNAPFYTRVGVISMSDKPEVLYNLNMTRNDKVEGKVTIKKGVDQIDVVDAFQAALDMLSEGLKSRPDRANTRQVVYYMTDSKPKGDLNSLNSFKASQGVIIVNNFLLEGELEIPELKELASNGYYFTNDNNKVALQAFCKANCFCKSDKIAYGVVDPAIQASGGCYQSQLATAAYIKAKSTCSADGGIIAVVHDEGKGNFLQQLTTVATSDYFWIGYQKSDDGDWHWEDESDDPYTNWGMYEPSSASVAKCAYVDTTSLVLPWGAGNCQIGFPYVCQYAPCSVGKKKC